VDGQGQALYAWGFNVGRRAMAILKPFRGLRPPRAWVQEIACPPYDVVSASEARELAKNNPKSFFRISRPEVGLAQDVDEHSSLVYAKGAFELRAFVDKGWLVRDSAPRFYVYRQTMGDHAQVGLVGAASVEAYDRGEIRRHELTRADKEDDRTRHIQALSANDEPVFLTYRARPKLDALVRQATEGAPEYDFTAKGGVGHTLWLVPAELTKRLEQAFLDVPVLYIADGHHRSKAASRVQRALRAEGKGEGGHDFFLAVVFPHDQLQILAYNRLVKDLNGQSPESFAARVRDAFDVSVTSAKEPVHPHHFGMYLDRQWYRLAARAGTFQETPMGALDVTILQENLLSPLLGILDPRTDERIAFVGGIRGTLELERRVDSGEHRVAFSLYPTTVAELMAIADADAIMPPKSTWFEPKLQSGLVLHPFDA
jgi:uncharacterized protein (DUF1015 family)